ncbi:MAG: multicopper oxidase domain-containing protein [Cyanobium sp.]
MAAGSGPIPSRLRGPFFSEYYVYDGGPGDDDGQRNGVVAYTTYFGSGPYYIEGLGDYVRSVLGYPVPEGTPDLLHSFEDPRNQNRATYSPVYLYSFDHLDAKSGTLEAVSPGAMIQLNPGEKLKLTTKLLIDIDKYPEVVTGGVAFMEGGGAGSTNMHFHGSNSSPKGYGDNVDIENRRDSQKQFVNSIKLPVSHHEGLAWWHPHFHSSANGQVYGGAFGNLQIGDSLRYVPKFRNAARNFIGIKNYNVFYNQDTAQFEVQTSQFTPEETARNIQLLNGEYQPTRGGFTTGEWNSFSFINYASNSYYNIKIVRTLPDVTFDIKDKSTWGRSVDLYIYGKDGYPSRDIQQAYTGINNTILNGLQLEDPVGDVVTNLPSPDLKNNLFLSPARRYETLAYFRHPGEYKIISEAWTGAGLRAGGWIWPNIELGTLVVEGETAAKPGLLPSEVEPEVPYPSLGLDLEAFEPLRERRITWSGDLFVEGPNRYTKINGVIYDTSQILENGEQNRYGGYPTPFLINDNILPYNPALIVQLDTLEYWHHENWASEQHPFHPHQNHFQVVDPLPGPTRRFRTAEPVQDSPEARSALQLFIAYLGRFPNPRELQRAVAYLKADHSESDLARVLSGSRRYAPEFQRFYTKEIDQSRNPFTQVADGAYYTLTRDNIYNALTTVAWSTKLAELGIEQFPLVMLQELRSGSEGPAVVRRLDNLATVGLYAVNKVAETGPNVTVGTALLRVLNQQIVANPNSVTRLYPIIDQLLEVDPNAINNGEDYYGSTNRMDTVALPAAMIKTQSFSSPSTNRYPAPAAYNEWEPGRITTATTFDNFTGGFLQHCHILPHEDSGQAVIVKIIDNMERSWLAFKKEFAPGEPIRFQNAATFESFTLPARRDVSQRIAFGDINKDGCVDIVVGEGDGGSDLISVYSGLDRSLITSFHAFTDQGAMDHAAGGHQHGAMPSAWRHGVHLDVADVTGDGLNDICIGAGKGGGNLLTVFTNTPSGFQFAGDLSAFDSRPEWADKRETRFTLGDFDADNFTDFAFIGSEKAGNPIEVRSSRNGTVLSLFQSGLQGEIGLSSGFSSFQNLGLETLYMYEKHAPTAIVQAATLRAAMYVAHSSLSDNPYYDAAKYEGYASADEQVLLSQPVGILPATLGFDWLLADRFSASERLPNDGADPITAYRQPLELEATFSGYYANPVLLAQRGDNRDMLTYTAQSSFDRVPGQSSDAAYREAARAVIGVYVTTLQRLPSPAELHRFSERICRDGKSLAYIRKVITYQGDFDPANRISVDAIADTYYNHSTGKLTYAYQGVTDLERRSTYRMIGDSFRQEKPISPQALSNIETFGMYLDQQLVNNMNVDGDILMYLGASSKVQRLLRTAYRSIDADPRSLRQAIDTLNREIRGDYIYPMGPSSPLANGLNVESPTYSPMISTTLHRAFGKPPVIADPNETHHQIGPQSGPGGMDHSMHHSLDHSAMV